MAVMQMFLQFLSFGKLQNSETSILQNEKWSDENLHDLELCKHLNQLCDNKQVSKIQISENDHSCGDSNTNKEKSSCANCQIEISKLKKKLFKEIADKNQKIKLLNEYEKNIQEWIIQKNTEIENLKKERDNNKSQYSYLEEKLSFTTKHLDTLEISFNDVHEKYKNAKQTIQVLQKNVKILNHSLAEHQDCIDRKHSQYMQLKEHATERLNYANIKLASMEKTFATENSKLKSALNEGNMKFVGVLKELQEAKKKNVELTRLYNDLLKKLKDPNENQILEMILQEQNEQIMNTK